jgi:hypothetical protein
VTLRFLGMSLLLSGLLLPAAGCRGRDPNLAPLVPAGGTVTLDGKPLAAAQVTFIPAGSTKGNGASGQTDQAGRYQLESNHGRGAVAGQYRVTIAKLVMPDGSAYSPALGVGPIDSPARQVLLPCYNDPQQSRLTATVTEGGSDKLDFALKSKP